MSPEVERSRDVRLFLEVVPVRVDDVFPALLRAAMMRHSHDTLHREMKKHRGFIQHYFILLTCFHLNYLKKRRGVSVRQSAKGLACHVCRELGLLQIQGPVPELQDLPNFVDAHVAVAERRFVAFRSAEESNLLEFSVVVKVSGALVLRKVSHLVLEEVFVAFFFFRGVPLDDVVEAAVGAGVVYVKAAAAHRVACRDRELRFFAEEDELGPVGSTSILEVCVVLDGVVGYAVRVDRVPAVDDEENGE